MPTPEIFLAITMWLAWTIRSAETSAGEPDSAATSMSTVSLQRLMELGSRLQEKLEPNAALDAHQLIRFNLYNFGEEPVAVRAVGLTNLQREGLRCELVPSVVVAPGARYPVMIETTKGPVTEAVDVEVDVRGRRAWVSVQSLPRS